MSRKWKLKPTTPTEAIQAKLAGLSARLESGDACDLEEHQLRRLASRCRRELERRTKATRATPSPTKPTEGE